MKILEIVTVKRAPGIGLCGDFTTFSAFNLQIGQLCVPVVTSALSLLLPLCCGGNMLGFGLDKGATQIAQIGLEEES